MYAYYVRYIRVGCFLDQQSDQCLGRFVFHLEAIKLSVCPCNCPDYNNYVFPAIMAVIRTYNNMLQFATFPSLAFVIYTYMRAASGRWLSYDGSSPMTELLLRVVVSTISLAELP